MKKYLVLVILLFSINNSNAWSGDIHAETSNRAAYLMPDEYRTFILDNIASIEMKSKEPDWVKGDDPTEGPRHYDDIDVIHQDINVSSSSSNYSLGVIAWATANSTYNLALAINASNSVLMVHYMGYIAHYSADSTQPLHGTKNYNGQLTGNDGIHSRFEVELTSQYYSQIWDNNTFQDLSIVDAYDTIKDNIRTGLGLVDDIITADNTAKASTSYYNTLWSLTDNIVKSRLNRAIQTTANLWYSAYKLVEEWNYVPPTTISNTTENLSTTSSIFNTTNSITSQTSSANNSSNQTNITIIPIQPFYFLIPFALIILIKRKSI